VNDPKVWSKLARAQLDERMVSEAISSYIKVSVKYKLSIGLNILGLGK
jgi:hypothetical protein